MSDACFAGLDLAVLTLVIALTGTAAVQTFESRTKRVHACTDMWLPSALIANRLRIFAAMEPVCPHRLRHAGSPVY